MDPEEESLDLINYNIDQQIKSRMMYEKTGIRKLLSSQKYDEIIKQKELFTDDIFPPNNGSIYNYMTKYADLVRLKQAKYKDHVEVL